jgi:hypothetical protein
VKLLDLNEINEVSGGVEPGGWNSNYASSINGASSSTSSGTGITITVDNYSGVTTISNVPAENSTYSTGNWYDPGSAYGVTGYGPSDSGD